MQTVTRVRKGYSLGVRFRSSHTRSILSLPPTCPSRSMIGQNPQMPNPIPSPHPAAWSLPMKSFISAPTSELSVDRLKTLCRPVFDEARAHNPTIAWAGVFGSVQRGTQRPDSDVDVLVGYAAEADFFGDVCGSYTWLQKKLPEALGREVDLVVFTLNDYSFAYVHLEALLTAETIWGDASWVESSRAAAESLLREGYVTTKQALQTLYRLRERLPSSQSEFASPESTTLRVSILTDLLSVITLVKKPRHPFYGVLQGTMPWLLAKEDAIRAAAEATVENPGSLDDIWSILCDRMNVSALKGMVQAAEQTFSRAGLVP